MASYTAGNQQPLNAIVADVGRYATKLGWAGDDQPKSYFRSNVAVLREQESGGETSAPSEKEGSPQKKAGARRAEGRAPIVDVRYDYFNRPILGYNNNKEQSGGDALDGHWEVSNPVDATTGLWYQPTATTTTPPSSLQESTLEHDGADWADLIPLLLRHGYQTGLSIRNANANNNNSWEYPLLLCEKSYNPPPLRQQMLEILMEEMQVPSVFLGRDAVLSAYACGRTQGTVVDIGYSGTTVTPVYEGYAEVHGIQRSPVGLETIDLRVLQHMDQLANAAANQPQQSSAGFLPLYQVKQQRDLGFKHLQRRSAPFHEAARLYWAQECRLTGAGVAVDTTLLNNNTATTSTGTSNSFQAPHKAFHLPDGTEIHLTSQFRFHSANILLGRPLIVSNSNNADGGGTTTVVPTNKSPEQEARLAVWQKNKLEWTAYLEQLRAYQQQQQSQQQDKGPSIGGSAATDEMDFSDAAAVGIAKRKTKRQRVVGTAASAAAAPKSGKNSSKRAFSNARLNAACLKYFTNLVDHSVTSAPIAQMICEAAYKCDRDQQPALLANVLVGGGGACLGPTEQAVPDLLREQTESLIHTHTHGWRTKVLAPPVAERSVLSWLGGSILGSLGSFHELYVTKADYDEWGSAIVNRKCP